MLNGTLPYLLFVVGFFLLVYGARWLVDGSSSIGKRLKIPSIAIGLTVVAFGTSAPEFFVNLLATLSGTGDVAFGNIIGSNISNTLLILGVVAIIAPIAVDKATVRKQIPFSLLAILALFFLINDYLFDSLEIFSLTRVDGLILLCFFGVFMYYVYELIQGSPAAFKQSDVKIKARAWYLEALMIFGGIVALFLGGKWVVDGAVFFATQIGISEYVIAATIVAVGTSLPELVTSVVAIMKKEEALAVGNIIGSNVFNIFWVLGLTSVIKPLAIPGLINVDIFFLMLASIALMIFILYMGSKYKIDRREGIFLVVIYLLYVAYLLLRGYIFP